MPTLQRTFIILSLLFCALAPAQSMEDCQAISSKGIEKAREGAYSEALSLLTMSNSIAQKNHWRQQQIIAINGMGITYGLMLEYGTALSYHFESYKLASEEEDPKYKALVILNIGCIYIKQKKYKEAEEYFKQIYGIYKESKSYENLGTVCGNLGLIFNETNRLEEARKYLDEASFYLKDNPKLSYIHLEMVENEFLQGRTTAARARATQFFTALKNDRRYVNPLSYLILIAKTYKAEDDTKNAILTCERILKSHPDLEDKLEAFSLLSGLYFKNNNYKKANTCNDSIRNVKARLSALKNNKLYENAIIKLEIQNYKNEIAHRDGQLATERRMYGSVIITIIAIVVILLLILRQKKLMAEAKARLLEHKVLQNEQKQEQLQREIEIRNRKLSARALFLSDRNQLIYSVIDAIAATPELTGNEVLDCQISELKSYMKNDDEWGNFISHFEEVNPGFLGRLKEKHPSLTANDMRYIAYAYMNLTAKEIANLLNITIAASKKRNARIVAKIDLAEEVSLYSYISAI